MKNEKKINQLNMLQQIITRMGNNSFSLREWTVGIMIAIFAFAGNNAHKAVVITLVPIFVFWLLDAYYLMQERCFRALYDDVRLKKESEIDFNMNFSNCEIAIKNIKKYGFINVMFSKTVWPFYLACIVTTLIVYFFNF